MQQYDVVVIGGGPGGYVAAIRAAQLGANVALIERGNLGGTCLNVGCIPTKAWVQSAHVMALAQHARDFGVEVGDVRLDFAASNKFKGKVVEQLVRGVGGLMKANGIDVIPGSAQFVDAHTLAVDGDQIGFANAIIATGSFPTRPPIPGIDDKRCVDSTGLLAQETLPARLLVLGGGVIGCEFASIFARFGTKVTLVEMLPRVLVNEEEEASKLLQKELKARGVDMHFGCKVERLEGSANGVTGHWSGDSGSGSAEADLVLVATGRAPQLDGLDLDAAGIGYDLRSGIQTDEHMRTTVPHIFAVGDVAGHYQLAHTASREGEVAAENALGHDESTVNYRAVPRVVYTDPEVAAVGLTEAQARELHGDDAVHVGQFPFAANSRAAIYGERTGFIKVVWTDHYHELLGVTMVGGQVSDMISAGVTAIEAESTIETVAHSIQAHPTLAEALKEAALDAMGQVVHMPPTKKRAPAGSR